MITIAVRDGTYGVRVSAGDSAPLLALHGFTGSGATWDALAAAMPARRVIAPDLPGHGETDVGGSPARHRIARTIDDLDNLLDDLEIERTALLGYSMGGRIALRFALRHPERITALIVESSSVGLRDDERPARIAADGALATRLETDGLEAFVDHWQSMPLWESQRTTLSAGARRRLRTQRMAQRVERLAASLRGAGAGCDPAITEQLAGLRLPSLLISGALDRKYCEEAAMLHRGIAGSRWAAIPNAGHAVHIEQPHAFRDTVAAFLDAQK